MEEELDMSADVVRGVGAEELSKSILFVRSEMLYEVLERRIKNRYIQRCPVTTEVKEHELKSSGVMTKVSEHRCECRGDLKQRSMG